MKKLWLGWFSIAVLVAGPALAADLPRKAPAYRPHRPHRCLVGLAAISADMPAARGKAAMAPNSPISATPHAILFREESARRTSYRLIRGATT